MTKLYLIASLRGSFYGYIYWVRSQLFLLQFFIISDVMTNKANVSP